RFMPPERAMIFASRLSHSDSERSTRSTRAASGAWPNSPRLKATAARTVSNASVASSCGTRPITRLAARVSRTMSWPATTARPAVRFTSPQITPISVVLPAPFGPSRAKISPWRISRLTSCRAVSPPGYVFDRPSIVRMGCTGAHSTPMPARGGQLLQAGGSSASAQCRQRRGRLRIGSLHRQSEGASLDALQRAHVHDLARHLFVALVAHHHQDGELGGCIHAFGIERALDLPGGPGSGHAARTRILVEAQVMFAPRADDRAFEDRRPAMGAGAGGARVIRRARRSDHATLAPRLRSARLAVPEDEPLPLAPSSKPKS